MVTAMSQTAASQLTGRAVATALARLAACGAMLQGVDVRLASREILTAVPTASDSDVTAGTSALIKANPPFIKLPDLIERVGIENRKRRNNKTVDAPIRGLPANLSAEQTRQWVRTYQSTIKAGIDPIEAVNAANYEAGIVQPANTLPPSRQQYLNHKINTFGKTL
ncbi:hypothetical protein HMPREF3152_00230 [Actinomyces sp. HMSC06A08]|uniref:Uncharacterized protein n=2 Tax=Winkia neuii TaxID=33007 RepID=A0A2I1IMN1_9ACTO|nr:hypothetical protein HMPREF2851_00095 [Actinomyces sp. HMSC064C12]OFT56974.1 hypothetical protein HMPREF3152_00230 [Actinomyces sp. HMSC06A08]PKY72388.1 hypothetical protein CYJ19_05970 [Winkia neuii]